MGQNTVWNNFFKAKLNSPPLQKKLIWKMKKRSNIDINCYKQQMFQF